MSNFKKALVILALTAVLAVFAITGMRSSCNGQKVEEVKAAKDDGPPKVEDVKAEAPKDGTVYVWSLPNQGHQSLIVLNVIDGNTLDAAYLVPVRIKLRGAVSPGINEKGGKEAQKAVDKLVGGQLRTAQLWGVGKDGIVADFWIAPENEKEKGQWLSAILIKQGVAKESK